MRRALIAVLTVVALAPLVAAAVLPIRAITDG